MRCARCIFSSGAWRLSQHSFPTTTTTCGCYEFVTTTSSLTSYPHAPTAPNFPQPPPCNRTNLQAGARPPPRPCCCPWACTPPLPLLPGWSCGCSTKGAPRCHAYGTEGWSGPGVLRALVDALCTIISLRFISLRGTNRAGRYPALLAVLCLPCTSHCGSLAPCTLQSIAR